MAKRYVQQGQVHTDHQRVLYKGGLKRLQEARQEKDGKRRGRLSFDALHFMKAVCAEPYCLPGKKFSPDPAGIDVHLRNSPKLAWMLSELEDIKAKLKPKKSSISAEMLDTANTYDDKVAIIRMMVAEDSGRVANVLKGMIKIA